MNIDFHVLVFVDIFKLINTHYVSVFAKKKILSLTMCTWIVITWGFAVSGWNFIS